MYSVSLSLSLFFLFPAIPQFQLLSQVSSLRLSSGHSGPVLPYPKHRLFLPSPAVWWWMQAAGLLLHWQLWLGTYSVCFFFFFPFPPSQLCFPLRCQNSHRPTCERVSYCVETSPPSGLPPQDRSLSLTLLSLFWSFIFFPSSFQRRAAFLCAWCPPPAEVVLWKLLSIQMVFWWICVGESGLPVLFLHHLRTAPNQVVFLLLSSFCVVDGSFVNVSLQIFSPSLWTNFLFSGQCLLQNRIIKFQYTGSLFLS